MSTIIIGNGPSILAEKMGCFIDTFDNIVRLKRCHNSLKNPDYYGTKTTHVGGSLTIAGDLREVHAGEYWIFFDSRHAHISPDILTARMASDMNLGRLFNGSSVICDQEICNQWDEIYRKAREPMEWSDQMQDSKSSDIELGENHTSQGFKAILYACKYLEDKQINLIGFDNLFTGKFTWSTTRGPEWDKYPKHNWATERKLLEKVKDTFNKDIRFIYSNEVL
mgnify:CR=1 FL=1